MGSVSKIYYTTEITPENIIRLYDKLGKKLNGKVAVKVHSGEAGNQNFLKPLFWKPIIDYVDGTVVECNTAYEGERNYTDRHIRLIQKHGWNDYFNVDLMDAEGPDIEFPINRYGQHERHLVSDIMGKKIFSTMIPCLFFLISKAIRWEDSAVLSSSCQLDVLPVQER